MWTFSYPIEEQYYDAPLPRITIPMLDVAQLPGLPLRSEELESMVEIPYLVNYMDGTESPDRARFWLAYDSEGLVLAGKLFAPSHGRDDVVEDQVEHEQLHILINPTPGKKRGYRIRLRPNKVMTIDAGGEDAPVSWWGNAGELAQQLEEDGWSLATKVPFSMLGVDRPEAGDMWRMNLFRYEYKRQEDNSSWSVMYLGRVDIPERYGEVVFGGKGLCGGIKEATVVPGRSRIGFRVHNLTKGQASTTIEVYHNGDLLTSKGHAIDPGKHEIGLEPVLSDGGEVLLLLRDARGESIAAWPINTGCQVLGPRIKDLRESMAELDKSPSRRLAAESRRMGERLRSLERRMGEGANDADTWHRFEAEMRGLEYETSMLATRSNLPDPDAPAALLSTHTLTKIIPDLPLPDVFSDAVDLKAPRRGSDSAQLVILAFEDVLEDCEVMMGPLKGPSVIGGDALEVWKVGNVVTRRPRYTVEHVGPHPDPLLPLQPFDVLKGRHEVLWLTASVPEASPPGTYQGWVEICAANSRTLRIPACLKVWDFDLPVRSTLRTTFPMFEGEIEKFYGRPLSDEQRRLYYDFLLKRRISPSCQYEGRPRPREEDMDVVMDKGSNVISMGYLEYEDLEGYIDGIRPMVDFLREREWLKWAYVYGFDEVGPPGYPKLMEAYGKVKEAYPDLPRAVTIGPEHDLPKIFGTVDIWIPQTDRFEAVYKERQSRGDELWWYVSMWPRHPFANMFIDYPAIDHRILFWQTWKYGITGFLYYCINLWSSNCVGQPSMERETAALPEKSDREALEAGARWPDISWNTYTGPTATNGDGQMVYPGPNGSPLSSVRLECVRHGIEDYEMLAKLGAEIARVSDMAPKEMIEAARALLEVPPELCRDLTKYSKNPEVLLGTRERVGDLIEKLSSL